MRAAARQAGTSPLRAAHPSPWARRAGQIHVKQPRAAKTSQTRNQAEHLSLDAFPKEDPAGCPAGFLPALSPPQAVAAPFPSSPPAGKFSLILSQLLRQLRVQILVLTTLAFRVEHISCEFWLLVQQRPWSASCRAMPSSCSLPAAWPGGWHSTAEHGVRCLECFKWLRASSLLLRLLQKHTQIAFYSVPSRISLKRGINPGSTCMQPVVIYVHPWKIKAQNAHLKHLHIHLPKSLSWCTPASTSMS